MGFAVGGLAGTELAQSDSLAVVGATPTSVNKGRVETMHVEVLIVDKEAFSNSRVTVIKCVDVEPKQQKSLTMSIHAVIKNGGTSAFDSQVGRWRKSFVFIAS